MDLEKQLLDLEEQFWKGSGDFYQRHLTDDSLMVFADPVGVLTRDRTIETISAGPRWVEVGFEEVRVVRLTEDAALLTYKASARREGEESQYSARASSAYVRRGGSWKLAFHQQTPG